VRRLEALATAPGAKTPVPYDKRPKLARCLEIIDAINKNDPKLVPVPAANGKSGSASEQPFRLAYGRAVFDEVVRLEGASLAPDALLILARGRQVESWLLPKLFKRDDYAPNTAGNKLLEADRKRWMARRLVRCMREAGYRAPATLAEQQLQQQAKTAGEPDPYADVAETFVSPPSSADAAANNTNDDDAAARAEEAAAVKLVDEVMLGRNVPDPRDLRPYDFSAPLGAVNFPLLRAALAVQALDDADALVFLDRNFARMLDSRESGMTADEAAAAAKKELGRMSARAVAAALRRPWVKAGGDSVKQALYKALPVPFKYSDLMLDAEGTAAASVHPGDWRYRDFDYE
jgi:hypothetical protein